MLNKKEFHFQEDHRVSFWQGTEKFLVNSAMEWAIPGYSSSTVLRMTQSYSFILLSSNTTGLSGSGQAMHVFSLSSSQGNSPPCRRTLHDGKRAWNALGQSARGSPDVPRIKSLLKSNSCPSLWPAAQLPLTETIFKMTFSGFAID